MSRMSGDVPYNVFHGTVPRFRCSDVTGADCDTVFPADQPHCGNEDHVVPPLRGVPSSIPREFRPKPRLVVDEDYELVDEDESQRDLDHETFDPQDVRVSQDVQRAFTWFHNVTPEIAIKNIRFVMERVLAGDGGNYHQSSAGLHHFVWRGSRVSVTPDLACAIRYTTAHFERTPLDVFNDVPSRAMRERERIEPLKGPPRPYPAMIEDVDAESLALIPAAVSMYLSRSGLGDVEGTEQRERVVRDALAVALESGEWHASDKSIGAGILHHQGLGYVVSGRGPALVAVFKVGSPPGE